jgi:transposase
METLREHYARLLGLDASWLVASVELSLPEKRVLIRLEHAGGPTPCPECQQLCGIADHAPERRWRHLDTMQFTTELTARTPRTRCPACGVKTIAVPWAGKHSRFTLLFEAFAIEVLQASASLSAAADLLGLHWDAVQTIMDRAVQRGLERRSLEQVHHVGMDEKSFKKGQSYISVLTDLDGSRVLDVAPDRTEAAADQLWQTLPPEQRQLVRAVATDMCQAYVNSARTNAPQAEIVHDRYHVSKHLNEAVDKVRREENRALLAIEDDRLAGTRFLWLFARVNFSARQRRTFKGIKKRGLKTARAWAIKEQFRWFWRYVFTDSAADFFDRWYAWAARCRLEPVKKVAKMLKRHLPSLLSYFRHRITNAASEGYNSAIQALKSAARGFRRFDNYRARILFYCGKLDLMP